jgi:hypothetical protein
MLHHQAIEEVINSSLTEEDKTVRIGVIATHKQYMIQHELEK